jgi:hypothetical protein
MVNAGRQLGDIRRHAEPHDDDELQHLITHRSNSGSFAMFAAIRRASSLVSSLAADRRPGSSS